MVNKKIIFVDVDGTLVNENGIVPKSAEIAIEEARENGHYIFLCTGRSKAELFDYIMKIGFDGIIAAAGGYIEYKNEVIMHKKVESEKGVHKALAIEILIKHLSLPKEDTFAYGDGFNDIEMLEYVNTGVAMGNANDELKKIADDVTDTHNEDGIYNSFMKYGLI